MKHKLFISVSLLFLLTLLAGQERGCAQTKMALHLADKYFNSFSFSDAIPLYEIVNKKEPANYNVVRKLSESNHLIGNSLEEEHWLSVLYTNKQIFPEEVYKYYQVLKGNGKYVEAQKILVEYEKLKPDDDRITRESSLLEYIKYLQRDSSRYEVHPVEINSEGSEFGVSYYGNKSVVFASTRQKAFASTIIHRTYRWNNQPFLKLFMADVDSAGNLSKVRRFAQNIKEYYHLGPACFSDDGGKMILTCNSTTGSKSTQSNDGTTNLKLYVAEQKNGKWEIQYGFHFNDNNYSVGHASMDDAGTVIYFSSNMPGGYGGSDIYCSTYRDGHWTAPHNLGPKVNTPGNEMFPFVASDGTLYFSSDGHGGMGGLDIFEAVPIDGVFDQIENLGAPINSSKDDFAFVLKKDESQGYFSSNRLGGKGSDDIYHFIVKNVPIIIKGIARDGESNNALWGVKINLYDETGRLITTVTSSERGSYQFELERKHLYYMKAEKASYATLQRPVTTVQIATSSEIHADLSMEPEMAQEAEVGPPPLSMEVENGEPLQIISLDYINYDYNKWNIREDAAKILDHLTQVMHDFPDLEIRLESHTDSRGSDAYNLLLSKQRAKSAFDYLVQKGVDPNRMQYAGYGSTRPIKKYQSGAVLSEEDHALNRRTIVRVIRKGEYKKKGSHSKFYF